MTMTLHHAEARVDPPRDGDPVAILLHGRGADMHDLLGLRPALPSRMALLTPQAPFPGAPWGYGPGWAWYRYVSEDRVVPETLESSLAALDGFLDALPKTLGVTPGPVLLGGFSQGGTTSLAYGLTRPDRVAMVANFSGFLVGDPGLRPERPERVPPVFWAHGTADPAIPHALALRGRQTLEAWGVDLTVRDDRSGHWIVPDALAALSDWVLRTLD